MAAARGMSGRSPPARAWVVTGCVLAAGCVPAGGAERPRANVDAARELDQEGVRSFRESRFADAARYFRAAFELGGPSSELWNIARSEERRDDVEAAVRALDEYLARRDLTAGDRAEAEHEVQGLRARPSIVTVTTTPVGASIAVDGRTAAGTTPVSIDIAAGAHTVVVRKTGFAPVTRSLDAKLGRAVIVSLDLAPAEK
jgi:PEGA domain